MSELMALKKTLKTYKLFEKTGKLKTYFLARGNKFLPWERGRSNILKEGCGSQMIFPEIYTLN